MTPPPSGTRTPTRPRPTPTARPRPVSGSRPSVRQAPRPASPRPPAPRPAARRRPPPPPRGPRRTRLGRAPVRLRVALLFLTIVLSIYVVRLFELQALDAPVYAADATDGRTVTRALPAERGSITDRNGVVLAESVAARDITADPTFVKDPAATAAALAPVLGLDPSVDPRAHRAADQRQALRLRGSRGHPGDLGADQGPRPRGHLRRPHERPVLPRADGRRQRPRLRRRRR